MTRFCEYCGVMLEQKVYASGEPPMRDVLSHDLSNLTIESENETEATSPKARPTDNDSTPTPRTTEKGGGPPQ